MKDQEIIKWENEWVKTYRLRKGKMGILWVWEMGNDHYEVRKKAHKHGQWGMKQIHQAVWKFRTQNLVASCTLTLKWNLEHFMKSILGKLYIISNLWKSWIQHFKQYTNQRWNVKVMCIWSKLVREEFRVRNLLCISNLALWFRIGPSSTYDFKIDL